MVVADLHSTFSKIKEISIAWTSLGKKTGLAGQTPTTPVHIHCVSGINREADRRLKRVFAAVVRMPDCVVQSGINLGVITIKCQLKGEGRNLDRRQAIVNWIMIRLFIISGNFQQKSQLIPSKKLPLSKKARIIQPSTPNLGEYI